MASWTLGPMIKMGVPMSVKVVKITPQTCPEVFQGIVDSVTLAININLLSVQSKNQINISVTFTIVSEITDIYLYGRHLYAHRLEDLFLLHMISINPK